MENQTESRVVQTLVVEGDEHDRLAIRRALGRSSVSFEIKECVRAEEALEQVGSEDAAVDVVLIDQSLPGMSGLELCAAILEKDIDIPLVLLTESGSEQLAVEALKSGVADYLIKDPGEGFLELLPIVLREVVGKHEDRLARWRAEIALRESEERLRMLIESAEDIIAIHNFDGRVIYYHGPSRYGMTGKALVGKNIQEILNPLEAKPLVEQIQKVATTGKSINVENSVTLRGNTLWFSDHIFPVRDQTGQIVSVAKISRNITDQKQLEEQLRQASKIEAVGRLAGGVAHNVNNLLMGIIGNLSLIEMSATGEIRQFLADAQDSAEQAAKLVKQLLAFSQQSRINRRPIDLNLIFDDVKRLSRETIDRRIDIVLESADNLPHAYVDPTQINTVLMSLCINARDAIKDVIAGRTAPERRNDRFFIKIGSRFEEITDEYVRKYPYARTGDFVVMSVTDNGKGMDEETKRHVFEPFFTTKEVGKGVGLGLSSAYGIIKQHDGWVNLDSEPGKGTTFEVYLPVAEESKHREAHTSKKKSPPGSGTILLADDEEVIRTLGKTILERCGYEVLLAADGKEAINTYLKEKDSIDLVILDLSMPLLSGREVLQQIHVVNPATRVIISSGYGEEDVAASRELGATGYITKPYRPDDLTRKVREALEVPPDTGSGVDRA